MQQCLVKLLRLHKDNLDIHVSYSSILEDICFWALIAHDSLKDNPGWQ